MNIVYVLIIFILGFIIPYRIKPKLSRKDQRILNILWLYHIFTSIAYYSYIRINGGDSLSYWIFAKRMTYSDFLNNIFGAKAIGANFMAAINYIPAHLMGMNFFANTLLYGLLGFIAFTFLYRICIQAIPYNSKFYKFRLFPLLLFLPNLHFWSSGLGKDTISFLCILMVAYGFMRISKRFLLIIFGLLLSFGIRPHITFMLIASFGFAYLINGKMSLPQRIGLFILMFTAAILILPFVLNFVNMDSLSVADLGQFSNKQAGNLSVAGSGLDLSSYPYPLKVLTFLYRPFFFDINGIPAVVASFENLLLLLLSIRVIRNRFFATFKAAPLIIQGLFLFFIMGALVFSMSMSNLGIILRERNMFLPGLILFILWSFSSVNGRRKIFK